MAAISSSTGSQIERLEVTDVDGLLRLIKVQAARFTAEEVSTKFSSLKKGVGLKLMSTPTVTTEQYWPRTPRSSSFVPN